MNAITRSHSACSPIGGQEQIARLNDCPGIAELFKALADETRTRILSLLQSGELCVCQIAGSMEMSLPAVSHHLRLLKMMRLVSARRDGRQVYYTLLDQHVADLIRIAREHLHEGAR